MKIIRATPAQTIFAGAIVEFLHKHGNDQIQALDLLDALARCPDEDLEAAKAFSALISKR